MKLEVLTLCDAATDERGKLNVLGAFDTLWLRKIPAVHPQCAVALRLRFTRLEEGEHSIKIVIMDADGKSVMPPMEGKLPVRMPPDANTAAVNLILSLHGLKLANYGEYAIDVAMDGRQEASLPFFVRPIPAPDQSTQDENRNAQTKF